MTVSRSTSPLALQFSGEKTFDKLDAVPEMGCENSGDDEESDLPIAFVFVDPN